MPTFQSSPLNPAISWLFLGYFLVLFAERVQSLARICRTSFAALYRTGFDGSFAGRHGASFGVRL